MQLGLQQALLPPDGMIREMAAKRKNVRRRLQDVPNFLDYFLQQTWELLGDVHRADHDFIVIDRMLDLGIVCGKEGLMKLGASIAMFFSLADRSTLSCSDFRRRHACFKAAFKARAEKRAPDVAQLEYLEEYPKHPAELRHEAPFVWQKAFRGDASAVVKCTLQDEILEFDRK